MFSQFPDRSDGPIPGKLSLSEIGRMKRDGEKIAVVTAYDAPSGRLAEAAGVDCVLVGDSAAMTVLGHESTVSVTVDEMLVLMRAVSRTVRHALLVADMPFGSFQVSDRAALEHAIRFVKEGGADAVKLEGAGPTLSRAATIVEAGIPVMGHLGLTPQSATLLGGYKPQGRTARAATRLIDDAVALERAGCFAVVLEAVPEPVAARVTAVLRVPTIGIGAGASCDGQVLVWHDLLGLSPGRVPQFVKQYANIGDQILAALRAYVAEVRGGKFPDSRHTYPMPKAELELFEGQAYDAASSPRTEGKGDER
jgi:3-methyl-2-oxobutanoate hydroxymethyltransferase